MSRVSVSFRRAACGWSVLVLFACSCHIVVAEQSIREGQQVPVHGVEHRFHINHTTIQVEAEGCETDDMYCVATQAAGRLRH